MSDILLRMEYDELKSEALLKMEIQDFSRVASVPDLQSFLDIEFVIYDFRSPKRLDDDMRRLYHNFDSIIESAIASMPQYKKLARVEPSLSTLDERKQLRFTSGFEYCDLRQRPGTMLFSQRRSTPGYFFTLSELKTLAQALRVEIEKMLGREIGVFIVCCINA